MDLFPAIGLSMIWIVALVGVTAGASWRITGRMLRPVEAIRTELAAINGNDSSTRVAEARRSRVAARLARTINATLARLEQAGEPSRRTLAQQRLFIADASQRLRSPVSGLRIRLEDARAHPEDTDLPDLLTHALHDVERLQAVMTDLLTLTEVPPNSRPQPGVLGDH
ncbi:sensor histidine kinase family protein [Sphaerisporangium aureirubrum]|uniref:histidine kinase n=1 Tax=Sphaerisporangium aureirubrum TaxID=1544736 RepID=A0ABW1NP92_9ACTN